MKFLTNRLMSQRLGAFLHSDPCFPEGDIRLTLFSFESLLIVSVVGSWDRLLVP